MPEETKTPWWKRWGFQILKLGYAILAIEMKNAEDRKKGIEK